MKGELRHGEGKDRFQKQLMHQEPGKPWLWLPLVKPWEISSRETPKKILNEKKPNKIKAQVPSCLFHRSVLSLD